ncbi:MAG: beta strand repeat-containing protein [Gemmataceae bacterium]
MPVSWTALGLAPYLSVERRYDFMQLSWLRRLINNTFFCPRRSPPRRDARRYFRRLELERLEDRLAPATAIWTGAAGDGLWTTAANWNGGVAPVAGDDLIFPDGAATLTVTNDFTVGTTFSTITINGGDYTLNGNALFLSGGRISSSATTVNVTNTINLTILANNPLTIKNVYPTTHFVFNGPIDMGAHTMTLGGTGDIRLFGVISGTNATAIVKQGIGLTWITGNNTFSGTVFVNEGILVAQGNALGSALSGTVVADGASLGTNGTLNLEPVTVTGAGYGGNGAFGILPNTHGLAFGTGTFTGNLNMVGDTIINVRAGTTLTMSGTLSGNANLIVQDRGFLNFSNAMTYTGDTIINGGRIQLSGNSGAVTATPNIHVNLGGSLFIDNNAGPNPAPNRIPDNTDIYLNDGSTIFYQINNAAGRIQEERVGNIIVGLGTNRIQITPANQGLPAQSTLYAKSLQRTGPGAVLVFDSKTGAATRDLGTASNQILFDTAPALTNGIIPWAIVANFTAGNLFPASYDPVVGIRSANNLPTVDVSTPSGGALPGGPLWVSVANQTEFDNLVTDSDTGTARDTSQVNLQIAGTGSINLGTANRTFNSVTVRVTGTADRTLELNGRTLAIVGTETGGPARGLLLTTATVDNADTRIIDSAGGGAILFGATGEGIINFNNFGAQAGGVNPTNNFTEIRAPIASAQNLTLTSSHQITTAENTLLLSGTDQPNTYAGPTFINQGTVLLRKGGTNRIAIPSGVLVGSNGASTVGLGNNAILRPAGFDNQIAPTSTVIVSNTGRLDLQTDNRAETVANVVATTGFIVPGGNGHVSAGNTTGGLTVTNSFTVQNANATLRGEEVVLPARMGGRILISSTTNFFVDDTPALYDLDVIGPGLISTGVLNKSGGGVMVLRSTTANAYQFPGGINIFAGILSVDTNVTINATVNVLPGASLQGGRISATPGSVLNINSLGIIQPGQVNGVLGVPGTGTPYAINSLDGMGILRGTNIDLSQSVLGIQVKNLLTPGIDFDQLQATGTLTLGPNSTLVVNLLGLQDVTNAQIPIATATSISDIFGNIFVVNNPNNYLVFATYTNSTVFLNIQRTDVPATINDVFVTAPGVGIAGPVRVFDTRMGVELWNFTPFPGFFGEIRVAVADVNNDLVQDVIVAAGPGGGPHVKVYDGRTGQVMNGPLGSFFAYAPSFTGGVFVAAGDVNDDGFADIITGAGAGGGPHVKVFSGATGAVLHSFFAYTPGFTGGVRVAAGNVNGDLFTDIITGPGAGGGPHVKVFSGQDLTVLRSFFAYNSAFTGGIFVASGNLNGDAFDDIVTGVGSNGAPHVRAFSGANTSVVLANFFAYNPGFTGGVRVAVADRTGDRLGEIITAPGPGIGPLVRFVDASVIPAVLIDEFFAYNTGFPFGVFVGGGRTRFFS